MIAISYFSGKEYITSSDYKDYRIIKGKTKYSAKHNKRK